MKKKLLLFALSPLFISCNTNKNKYDLQFNSSGMCILNKETGVVYIFTDLKEVKEIDLTNKTKTTFDLKEINK